MAVKGVGVDIISINRVKDTIENAGRAFLDRVFTSWEQEAAEGSSNPIAYYATRFAGKEAIFKTFGIGWATGVEFTEIEIRDGKFGEPAPVLSGKFAELAREKGAKGVLLSLSYDGDYAVGMATLVEND